MHTVLFHDDNFTIYTYGIAYVFSIILTVFLSLRRAKFEGIPKERFLVAVFLAIVGIIVMGKTFHILVSWTWYMENPSRFFDFRIGHVFYGGYIGSITFPLIYLKWIKGPILPSYDIPATYMPLGLAIHRAFACLNAGCCFGRPTDLPWGIIFPKGSLPYRAFGSVPLHPTQIYESFLALVIFVILLIWRKRGQKVPGELFALQVALYSIGRFGIEFFRGDAIRGTWGPLSTSQWTSIAMLGLAVSLAIHIVRKRRGTTVTGHEI